MKTTSVDPQKVIVAATIDFHSAIKAIQEYAAKYPIERVSQFQADAVTKAGELLTLRLYEAGQLIWQVKRGPETLVVCPADPAPHPWSACGSSVAKVYESKTGLDTAPKA